MWCQLIHIELIGETDVSGNFTETELGEINFPEISAPILEKICEYFYYKLRYQNE